MIGLEQGLFAVPVIYDTGCAVCAVTNRLDHYKEVELTFPVVNMPRIIPNCRCMYSFPKRDELAWQINVLLERMRVSSCAVQCKVYRIIPYSSLCKNTLYRHATYCKYKVDAWNVKGAF